MNKLYLTLQPIIAGHPAFLQLVEQIRSGEKGIFVTGITGSFDALLLAEMMHSTARPIIVSAPESDAPRIADDIAKLIGDDNTILALPKTDAENDEKTSADILDGLERIRQKTDPLILVTNSAFITTALPDTHSLERSTIHIKRGDELGFDLLIEWLKNNGFNESQFVSGAGEYAVRGGIIDVFPLTQTVPYRIEFLGDVIESIREFDAINQRSIIHRESLELIADVLSRTDIDRTTSLTEYFSREPIIVTVGLNDEQSAGFAPDVRLSYTVLDGAPSLDFGIHSQPSFQHSLKIIKEFISELQKNNEQIIIAAESGDLVRRLEDLLNEESEDTEEDDTNTVSTITYLIPTLSHGFITSSPKVYFLTEHQLFGRKTRQGNVVRRKSAKKHSLTLRDVRSLKRGDLVVHEDKGIGKFMGLETIEVRGAKQEAVRLVYRDNDVLFVNLDYISKLSKYSAADVTEETVKLSKLGSAEWQRTKERTKKKLKDIARDLIKIYAQRKSKEGFAFSEDDHIQREMEAEFLYEDTPDQARATAEVKADMESRSPMDRLVCGDVGYGKTEVAMRAAMKAVLDKKQVAVLVPTTILAEQHYRSFSDRMEHFGVKVAALSRFRTTAEQKQILADLADGKIDIVIGTHRILSKDVVFKDIGLLIIDEEHRFGVAAKEKLRAMRAVIDTLTLTATPIPRTLNFSLLGARDLSVIETPPKNRLPVMTEILTTLESDIIGKAISRELERGGQIYAINDAVHSIEAFALSLKEIAPRASFGVIHGKMTATEIEKTMRAFLERRIDILCATKIVESGLDVPNANTIIINNAHRFGLAELYQLRGRVGRSNEQAYCYLVTRPVKQLNQDALKRLEAMEEFSELGAGFQLSMRDLEIRGAGNLLGAEQSGFINEIGFDLYQKTLAEAVDELKTEEFKDVFTGIEQQKTARNAFIKTRAQSDISISLGVDALIPEFYIEDDAERFNFYQRLVSAEKQEQIDEVVSEMLDRYGKLPDDVTNLIAASRIRLLAMALGIRRISYDKAVRSVRLVFPEGNETDYYQKYFPLVLDAFPRIGEKNIRLVSEKNIMSIVVTIDKQFADDPASGITDVLHKLQPKDDAIAA
jgi:transcription-repair coupling factor (superfamily II helicase)